MPCMLKDALEKVHTGADGSCCFTFSLDDGIKIIVLVHAGCECPTWSIVPFRVPRTLSEVKIYPLIAD